MAILVKKKKPPKFTHTLCTSEYEAHQSERGPPHHEKGQSISVSPHRDRVAEAARCQAANHHCKCGNHRHTATTTTTTSEGKKPRRQQFADGLCMLMVPLYFKSLDGEAHHNAVAEQLGEI